MLTTEASIGQIHKDFQLVNDDANQLFRPRSKIAILFQVLSKSDIEALLRIDWKCIRAPIRHSTSSTDDIEADNKVFERENVETVSYVETSTKIMKKEIIDRHSNSREKYTQRLDAAQVTMVLSTAVEDISLFEDLKGNAITRNINFVIAKKMKPSELIPQNVLEILHEREFDYLLIIQGSLAPHLCQVSIEFERCFAISSQDVDDLWGIVADDSSRDQTSSPYNFLSLWNLKKTKLDEVKEYGQLIVEHKDKEDIKLQEKFITCKIPEDVMNKDLINESEQIQDTSRQLLINNISPTSSPTFEPTVSPSLPSSPNPSTTPTTLITNSPSESPTSFPTSVPTSLPTKKPTSKPTLLPTKKPSNNPTVTPTKVPTLTPTLKPTSKPTNRPTDRPTATPTVYPTYSPSSSPTAMPTKKERKKPNILFIIANDLNIRVSGMGDKYASTPNIDRIINNGVVFDAMHVERTECAPSRLGFVTGLRSSQLRVWDFDPTFRKYNRDLIGFPGLFRMNGYKVIALGKIIDLRSYNGNGDSTAQNDVCEEGNYKPNCLWDYLARFELYSNKSVCSDNLSEYPGLQGKWPLVDEESPNGPLIVAGGRDVDFPDHCVASHAINYLELFKRVQDKPFLLFVGFSKPHLPWVAPIRYFDKFSYMQSDAVVNSIIPPNLNSANFWTKQVDEHTLNPEFELRSYPGYADFSKGRRIQAYYATVGMMDEQVGRVLNKLEETGLDENTIVVFWSDHGFHLGEHGNPGPWGKGTLFDYATRVPFAIKPPQWYFEENPDIKSGSRAQGIAQTFDIFPTLVEMTNISYVPDFPVNELAGTSLLPLMRNPKNGYIRAAAVSHYKSYQNPDHVIAFSLRTKFYRITIYSRFKDDTKLERALMYLTPPRQLWNYLNEPMIEYYNHYEDSDDNIKDVREKLLLLFSKGRNTDGWRYLLGKKPFDHEIIATPRNLTTPAPTLADTDPPSTKRAVCDQAFDKSICIREYVCMWKKKKCKPRSLSTGQAELKPADGCPSIKSSKVCVSYLGCWYFKKKCRDVPGTTNQHNSNSDL